MPNDFVYILDTNLLILISLGGSKNQDSTVFKTLVVIMMMLIVVFILFLYII